MSLNLSLYAIESNLANLIEMREQVRDELGANATPEDIAEEMAAIDNAIALYIKSEITKVNNIRAFWRHCELMRDAAKEEARVQSERSKAWGARLDRLKATCALVMESIPFPAGKPKKLEGRTGALYLKANGGKQAVEVTNEYLVPDEFCIVTVAMREGLWERTLAWLERWNALLARDLAAAAKVSRTPSLSLIGEQLAKGEGVPGAKLAERGVHVEVK